MSITTRIPVNLNTRLDVLEYVNIQIDDFVTVGDNQVTSKMFTEADIIVMGAEEKYEGADKNEVEVAPDKYEGFVNRIKTVRKYLETQNSRTEEILFAPSIVNFIPAKYCNTHKIPP